MVRVCVIGGGTAGAEAALEAAARGADVTIVERSERPDPPWMSWPDLIESSPRKSKAAYSRPEGRYSSVKSLREEAKTAGPGFLVTSEGQRLQFDSMIIATGTSFHVPVFRGSRKQGVFVLDSPGSYAELGVSATSSEEVVVFGEGFRGLQVADRLRGRCRKVHLVISEWQPEGPSPLTLGLLGEAARECGISLVSGTLTRAIGSGALEAVVTNCEVVACSVMAVVPRRVPRVLPMQVRLGRLGGLPVDRCMKTSASGTFAVGGCAELDTKLAQSVTLEGETYISGRIGGANCMGKELAINLMRFSETTAFGLRWTRVGMGLHGARASGLRVEAVSGRWGESSACEILYEKMSKRVVGVESVAPTNSVPSGFVSIPSGVSLQTLAYGGLGSSDISLVSDTARLGLREWRKS